MICNAKSGSALAAAAATLLLAGAAIAPVTFAEEAKGHCMGANACKGQGGCKTASNACKGQNGCKGHGFKEMTKAECDMVKGAKFEMPSKS
jgi:hypothetical protein